MGRRSAWNWYSESHALSVRGCPRLVCSLWVLACMVEVLSFHPICHAQSLHGLDGIRRDVDLLALDEQGWRFRDHRGSELDGVGLVRWGTWPGICRDQAVWLSDGSWLCGDVIPLPNGLVQVRSDWLASPELKISSLRGLVLDPPASLKAWGQLQLQMQLATGDQDQLWLRDGEQLQGVVRFVTNDREEVMFEIEVAGKQLQLAAGHVRAVVFSPTLSGQLPAKRAGTILGFVDGSLLRASQIRLSDKRLQVETDGGLELTSLDASPEAVKGIRLVQQFSSSAVYVSDLPVASYRHVTDSSLTWPLGVDLDVQGHPLMTAQGILTKGMAMHSSSQAAFRWDGSPARFLAEVVFAQPESGANEQLGSVSCQLMVAQGGKLMTRAAYELKRTSNTHPDSAVFDVDVSGAQLVVLVTEQLDYAQLGDHVLWLDARICK